MSHSNAGPLATEAATNALEAEVAAVTGQAPTTETTASTNSRLFTEAEMAEARRQEKEKVYPRLQTLEDELKQYRQEREDAQAAIDAAARAEAEEKRLREEAELSAKELLLKKEDEWKGLVNTVQQEWEQKFNALQAESEARQALLEREREYQELQSYKNRRLAEEQENITPELIPLVDGNTPEEIDAVISRLVEASSAIVQNIQQSLPQQQQRPRGISSVGGTPSGPLENSTEQQILTDADLKAMTMTQYAQIRDRLLTTPRR